MPSKPSHTFLWKGVPLTSRATENSLRLPAKYSPSSRSAPTRTGCVRFSESWSKRTRFGSSFSQSTATSPFSLATSFNFPTGESMVLYSRLINLSPYSSRGVSVVCVSTGSPQMLRRIRSPGPPEFGAVQQARRTHLRSLHRSCTPQNPNIGCWKCIGFANRSKGNVVRGPLANSADRLQSRQCLLDPVERTKQVRVGHRGLCDRPQCGQPSRGHCQSNRG